MHIRNSNEIQTIRKGFEAFEFERDLKHSKVNGPFEKDSKLSNPNSNHSKGISKHSNTNSKPFERDSKHSNSNSNHSKGIRSIPMQILTIRKGFEALEFKFESIRKRFEVFMQIRTIRKRFKAFEWKFKPFEKHSKCKFEPFERDSKHSNAHSNHSKEHSKEAF